MQIVILGAGAVGGYIGTRLLEAGEPVSFLVRGGRAEQLDKFGIELDSVKGNFFTEKVNYYTNTEEIRDCDVVIVTTKSYHIEEALPKLRTLVNKGAKILPFLNGMEHFEIFEKEFGKENVLGGLAFIIATLNEKGGVVHTSDMHDFVFGALHPSQSSLCDQLEKVLTRTKLNVKNSDNILKELWQKYAFITAFSGVTTASRMEIGKIRNTPETLGLFKETVKEMMILASAYGSELDEAFLTGVLKRIEGLPEQGTSSMHQDFRKGLPIEVEGLHGGALRLAKAKDVDLPVVQTLYGLLKPYEKGEPVQ